MRWFAWPARPRTATGVLLGAMDVVGVVHAAIFAVVWKIGPYFEPVKTFVGRHIH